MSRIKSHPCKYAIGNGTMKFYCQKLQNYCVCQKWCNILHAYTSKSCESECKDFTPFNGENKK